MKMILLIFLLFSPNYDLLTIMFILESYFYYIIHNINILYLIHINDFILSFAKAIKADSFFENIKIIKPYPNVSFAGEIKHTIVTIGLGEVDVLPEQLGDTSKYASIKINADFYVPNDKPDFANEVLVNIC